MVEVGSDSETAEYLRVLAGDCLGDLAPIRRLWNLALAVRRRIEFAVDHTVWTKRTIGIGFDRRVRQLFALDPIPDQIPPRPPWARYDLLGFPYGFGPDTPSTDEAISEWRQSADRRQAKAQAYFEKTGFSSIHRTDPMAPMARGPLPTSIIDELDALTELAMEHLVSPFAHLPLARRMPLEIVNEGSRRHGVHPLMAADLILGSTLVDIKLSASGSFERKWAVQLVRYLILDVDDHFGFNEVAIYEGRTGSLVTLGIGELIEGGSARLQEARIALRAFGSLEQ